MTLARQIMVLCGDMFLNWEDLGLIVGFLDYTEWQYQMINIQLPRSRRTQRIPGSELHSLYYLRETGHSRGGALSTSETELAFSLRHAFRSTSTKEAWFFHLEFWLLELRPCLCADKRDHIYSILDMVKDSLAPDMADPILPDYGLSVEQVYVSVASLMLLNIHSWSTLS